MGTIFNPYSKQNKYHNVKTYVGKIKFDSKKEANRYLELCMLEKSGMIKNLERQKRFEIVPKTDGERAVYYVADFVYEENGKLICEDVKSDATRRDKTYIIKRKLFKYLYKNYEFREV
ncbi:MAG: DUF1064 domain-containing protein [Methanobrevibacter sp.]|nr:DUF1064 domain-containing protein [Methanobrevibacter sp.]MBP5785272.1 DUF1064 domain-containing protein [Methanobrevibacter sp.]